MTKIYPEKIDSLPRRFWKGRLWVIPQFVFLDEKDNSQWEIIKMAIQMVKDETNEPNMTNSRAIELICANYIAGAGMGG